MEAILCFTKDHGIFKDSWTLQILGHLDTLNAALKIVMDFVMVTCAHDGFRKCDAVCIIYSQRTRKH